MSIPSEAWRDAPRGLRRVRHRGVFSDVLGGVVFVAGEAQSGMEGVTLARLVGCGIPLDDLGPWEDVAASPAESAEESAAYATAGTDEPGLPPGVADSPEVRAVVERAGQLARETEYAPGGEGKGQAVFERELAKAGIPVPPKNNTRRR